MKKWSLFLSIFSIPLILLAKESKSLEQKIVKAIRSNEPITIDGNLEETVWQEQGYSGFTQHDPVDGAEPSEKTTFWVSYDEEALYVAARMYDSQPESITSRLGRRDDFLESDWFVFSVDPYYDRRTGFQFAVNPAGSIVDWTLYNDEWEDTTWDGVWDRNPGYPSGTPY